MNFLNNSEFNYLRFIMNAPLAASFANRKITLLDEESIRKLGKEGIDIDDFSKIKIENDGTLSFQGKRVIVYIRDIKEIREQQSLPKYHLSYCSTLETMTQSNRFGRYVVATRDDGVFKVIYVGDNNNTSLEKNLNVCQNCLNRLQWDGFNRQLNTSLRLEKVKKFNLIDFYNLYPKDLISNIPTYTSDTAPLNDYSDDWAQISESIKKDRGYICEACSLDLSGINKKFLHAHHKDGQKNNNKKNNIELLCIRCHANETMHSHLKSTASFKDFSSIFKDIFK